jgi:hypothetical protein
VAEYAATLDALWEACNRYRDPHGVLDLDRTTMYTTFVTARPRQLLGGRISIRVPDGQLELAHEALAGRPEAEVFER